MNLYPTENLDEDEDDGTMPNNVAELESAVVGHRIVSAQKESWKQGHYPGGYEYTKSGLVITLDNGERVRLVDDGDCCAWTGLDAFLLHPERIDHVITGIGTTGGYTKWHVYADLGDVLELDVSWSCGNPFYYGYGFEITVEGES